MMSHIGDSIKNIGGKTADLFKKDDTHEHKEATYKQTGEKDPNESFVDNEKSKDTSDREVKSALLQFQQVSDEVFADDKKRELASGGAVKKGGIKKSDIKKGDVKKSDLKRVKLARTEMGPTTRKVDGVPAK